MGDDTRIVFSRFLSLGTSSCRCAPSDPASVLHPSTLGHSPFAVSFLLCRWFSQMVQKNVGRLNAAEREWWNGYLTYCEKQRSDMCPMCRSLTSAFQSFKPRPTQSNQGEVRKNRETAVDSLLLLTAQRKALRDHQLECLQMRRVEDFALLKFRRDRDVVREVHSPLTYSLVEASLCLHRPLCSTSSACDARQTDSRPSEQCGRCAGPIL